VATLSLLVAYFSVINQLDFVNKLLEVYFMIVAVMVLKKYLYLYGQLNMALKNYDFPIQFLLRQKYKSLHFTVLELASLLFASYLTYSYFMTRYWVANNILAIAFTIHCIENWLVGNIRFIALIFGGLVLYDVYFVFASDVMMTVAKSVELPIKILFPAGNGQFALLGLGDIVIPGLLCSMCIRYDYIQAFKRGKE
jgi:minor histocompatibility antigen H13